MSDTSPPLRGVFFAAIGTTILVLMIGIGLFTMRDRTVEPARFLPAGETIALFHRATNEDLARFAPLFRVLDTVPPLTGPANIAVLRLPNGTDAWVMYPLEHGQPIAVQGASSAMPNVLLSSSADPSPLLATIKNRLSDTAAYRALAAHASSEDSWTYLRTETLTNADSVPTDHEVQKLLSNAQAIATVQGKSDHLLVYVSDRTSLPAATQPLLKESDHPGSGIIFSDAEILWHAILAKLPVDRKQILESQTRTFIQKNIAADISLTYDLLPLLTRGGSVSVSTNSHETLTAVLQGKATQEELAALRSHLQASTASASAPVELIDQVLDEKRNFRLRGVREADSVVAPASEQKNDWLLEQFGGITLATMNQEFLLSKNREAVISRIDQATTKTLTPPSLPSLSSSINAAGYLPQTSLQKILSPWLSSPLLTILLPDLTQSDPLLWSVSSNSNILQISTSLLQ